MIPVLDKQIEALDLAMYVSDYDHENKYGPHTNDSKATSGPVKLA